MSPFILSISSINIATVTSSSVSHIKVVKSGEASQKHHLAFPVETSIASRAGITRNIRHTSSLTFLYFLLALINTRLEPQRSCAFSVWLLTVLVFQTLAFN